MKYKVIQKISPVALGVVLCSYQVLQGAQAYGASLKNLDGGEDQLLKPVVPEVQALPNATSAGCAFAPTGNGATRSPSSSPFKASKPGASGVAESSNVLASAVTGNVIPSTVVANSSVLDPASPSGLGSSSNLVAQVPVGDDCCEVGGTTTCEVGGVPPVGGAALAAGGLSPLLGLLGAPLLAIPFLTGGGGGSTPPTVPVPEPSSTAAITAGVGLLGLWYGRRRFRSAKSSS